MRPEVWQVITRTGPVVLVTGDSGTGKSSVLQATLKEYPPATIAPPVAVCLFDSGALQTALFDVLATVLATAGPGQRGWKDLARRLRYATREAALEVGKALAEAVIEEVVEVAKAKLGQNVGQGLLKFWKGLKKDTSPDLRRSLRAQSDKNVVRLLVRLGDEVAAVVKRDIVITLDEGNRLGDDDQRVLASLAAQPAQRVRVVIAWSTAQDDSRAGLTRLRRLGADEVEIPGLSVGEVAQWLLDAGLPEHAEQIYELSAGYPLLVEGLVAHLRSGGQLHHYSAPTVFRDVLDDALARLPNDAHHAARRLSAFSYPLSDSEIPGYLGVDAISWGVMRTALERERVFSVHFQVGLWFHEARRNYLWDVVLTENERLEIGQAAFARLIAHQRRTDETYAPGAYRQIAALAPYAQASLAENPALMAVIGLGDDQLGVLAAAIELQNVGIGSPTPADQVVIHAHTAYSVDRGAAIEALTALAARKLIGLGEAPRRDLGRSESIVDLLLDYECDVVARGRIQNVLGKAAVPHLADHVVRAHLERVRLESYAIITQAGHADALAVIANANKVRAPAILQRVGDPALGVWLHYGDQPVTVVGVFNTKADRAAAEREIRSLNGTSFGRHIVVDRTFLDPTNTIPSLRFMRAVYFATGLAVHSDGREYYLEHEPALPMVEFAQRQVDLLAVLASETSELEREVYDLNQPCGVAIARKEKKEYRLDVRGAAHVYPIDFEQTAAILEQGSLISARMELAMNLPATITTKHLGLPPDWLTPDL
ncbi:AAA family ATPase [Mycolicibacterium aichiense]|uniref:AAA family ATPase n=1 Tax=Mycolicibacterium aichiense TaxID=1799 RepID=UPI003D66469C